MLLFEVRRWGRIEMPTPRLRHRLQLSAGCPITNHRRSMITNHAEERQRRSLTKSYQHRAKFDWIRGCAFKKIVLHKKPTHRPRAHFAAPTTCFLSYHSVPS